MQFGFHIFSFKSILSNQWFIFKLTFQSKHDKNITKQYSIIKIVTTVIEYHNIINKIDMGS